MSVTGPTLLRAGELSGRPLVTLAGEQEAEIKDVIFERSGGRVAGFTLRNPGIFSRGRKDALPWSGVHGIGRDAVMVRDNSVLVPAVDLAPKSEARSGNVLGDRVLTDNGRDLGTVVDVVLQGGLTSTADGTISALDVVGYEIEASEALGTAGRRVFLPLPDTAAVSGENLMVPAAVTEFVSEDLSGFGAAVDAFRQRLRTGGEG